MRGMRSHKLARWLAFTSLPLLTVAAPNAAAALTVTPTDAATTLASALVAHPHATVSGSDFSGHHAAAGTFDEGPLGLSSGVVLTTGLAVSALPPSDSDATSSDHGSSGAGVCEALLGGQGFDPVSFRVELAAPTPYDGIAVPLVFGSDEYPASLGRLPNDRGALYLNGQELAVWDAADFSTGSVYGGDTELEYDAALSQVVYATLESGVNVLEVVLCDGGDGAIDSALFVGQLSLCFDGVCGVAELCDMIDADADGDLACTDCDDFDPLRSSLVAEQCNDIDDDCDGELDEGFLVGEACSAGLGACAASGVVVCDAGGAVCDAIVGAPQAEQCGDDVDSDCDGLSDPAEGCTGAGGGSVGGAGQGQGGEPSSGGAGVGAGSAGGTGSGAAGDGGGVVEAGGAAGEDAVPAWVDPGPKGCVFCETSGQRSTEEGAVSVVALLLIGLWRRRGNLALPR